MKLPHRRQFLHLAAGATALPAVSRIAWAQGYPTRPVRIIITTAAGGTADILARLMGQWLSERLGQPFVVENRPGGGTNIGTEAVVRAPADGYTLLLASPPNTSNATLYDKLNFNFIRDIAPIAGVMRGPFVMLLNPSIPADSVPEFIAYAKAHPGMINFASGGIGFATHLAGELFKGMTGVKMVHVPYRGQGPAMTDLLGGQVQVMFDPVVSSIAHIRAGKLRPLAVTTSMRSEALPDIPTVGEFVPGYEVIVWFRPRRTEGHAGRDRRETKQGDQRWPRRSQDQGAACRPRSWTSCTLTCRIWQVHRRRNREMGEGDQVRRHQGGLIRATPAKYSVTSVLRIAGTR
jgi:tripartite-type tricarboxylate transporter receptor subunit TctC